MSQFKTLVMLAAIFACTLTGCGDSNRQKLVGSWNIAQIDKVANRIAQNESDQEADKPETEGESRMVLSFQRNGNLQTLTMMGDVERKKEGTWEMTSFDVEAKTMEISCDLNGQNSDHKVTFVDENTIELVPPNMAGLSMKLKFKRD